MSRSWRQRLRRRQTRARDADVQDELDFHLDMLTRQNRARGMDEASARRAAEQRFGRRDSFARQMHQLDAQRAQRQRHGDRLGEVRRDVAFALRAIARRPGFTMIVVLTLALGIGATTAIFSLVNYVLWQPPVGLADPDALVTVRFPAANSPGAFYVISHADYADLAGAVPALRSLAASTQLNLHVVTPGELPRRMAGDLITDNYAATLGIRPRVGRIPAPADRDYPHEALISDRLWAEAYERAPDVTDRTIVVNGKALRISGVAQRGFRGTVLWPSAGGSDLWIPVAAYPEVWGGRRGDLLTDRRQLVYPGAIGRLAPGVTPALAEAQLTATAARIVQDHPEATLKGLVPRVTPGVGLNPWARQQVAETMRILFGVVAFLLLLACANAGNMLLARASARGTELSLRRALGASRARLVRQLLTEAMLLAGLSGGGGVALMWFSLRLFRGEHLMSFLPALQRVPVDARVLLFALLLSTLTGVLFAILPAFVATRSASAALHAHGRTAAGRSPVRTALVVAQVAISLTLLVAAGLLLASVHALRSVDLGFQPDDVLEASVDPFTQGYDSVRTARLLDGLLQRARQLPGVTAAGMAWAPIQGHMGAGLPVRPEGEARESEHTVSASANHITAGLLPATGMRLEAGRDFQDNEAFAFNPHGGVAIVNATLAHKLFPAGALGRRIDVGYDAPRVLRIVGVIADARVDRVKDPADALIYEPVGQPWGTPWATLYVRQAPGAWNPAALAQQLRAAMRELDGALPLYDVQPLTRRISADIAGERLLARITTVFATLALALAAFGLYGVLAFTVGQRTREIGVRTALGAGAGRILAMVLRQGLGAALAGTLIGLFAATQLTRLLSNRLFGVSRLDLRVFGLAALLLLAVAALACWVPARRATRVHPTVALRTD